MNLAIKLAPAPGRPEFIGKARARLEEILTRDPRRLLELHGSQMLPLWQRRRIMPRRRERLEAFGRVMGAMLERHDLVTARVGSPRSDGTVTGPGQQGPRGREQQSGLVVDTGLSITRLRRAINAGVRAGYLRGPRRGPDGKMVRGPSGRAYQHVEEYTDKATGERRFHAHNVVYVVTDLFFERLGRDIVKRLGRERTAAVERRRQRADRMYPGPLLAGRDLARGMRTGSREERRPGAPSSPTRAVASSPAPWGPSSVDGSNNEARLAGAIAIGLRNKHPDWPDSRVRAEALAMARGFRQH